MAIFWQRHGVFCGVSHPFSATFDTNDLTAGVHYEAVQYLPAKRG